MKEIEVDGLYVKENVDEIIAHHSDGSTVRYPGLIHMRVKIVKYNANNNFLAKIKDTDSLIIISDDGCLKTDNFYLGDYTFTESFNEGKVLQELQVEFTLAEAPLYAKNKEQLLIDII